MDFELGKTYEELEIGDHASFSKTITETDVYLFAGISHFRIPNFFIKTAVRGSSRQEVCNGPLAHVSRTVSK